MGQGNYDPLEQLGQAVRNPPSQRRGFQDHPKSSRAFFLWPALMVAAAIVAAALILRHDPAKIGDSKSLYSELNAFATSFKDATKAEMSKTDLFKNDEWYIESTDLRKTDSLVWPIVGYVNIVHSHHSSNGEYQPSTVQIEVVKDDGKWTVLQATSHEGSRVFSMSDRTSRMREIAESIQNK